MEKSLFGLTTSDVRQLAFCLVDKYSIDSPFNKRQQEDRYGLAERVLELLPELAIRTSGSSSSARVSSAEKLYDTWHATCYKPSQTGM